MDTQINLEDQDGTLHLSLRLLSSRQLAPDNVI